MADQQPLVIAHRGASHDAPQNTLAAFELAWEQDADGIEGDFQLTRAHECVDQPMIAALRRAGRQIHCWTVDDPATARRFAALGVDSITTNRPGWLRNLMNLDRDQT